MKTGKLCPFCGFPVTYEVRYENYVIVEVTEKCTCGYKN